MRARGLPLPVVLAALVATGALGETQRASRQEADRLNQKIDLIVRQGLVPRRTAVRTPITESEINSYFAVYGRQQLPAGVVDPRIAILGGDRVSAWATIDLDAVRRAGSGGWLDPASYLTGRVPVTAQGILRTSRGVARLQLESAQVAGITVPKTILQQIVSYYSRTPDYPNGVNLDDPFPLPVGIKTIEMTRGQAVVVQ